MHDVVIILKTYLSYGDLKHKKNRSDNFNASCMDNQNEMFTQQLPDVPQDLKRVGKKIMWKFKLH